MNNAGRALTVFSLAMLITGSIDSIRNLPATALFGSSLVFFLVLASIVFLIPAALVSAELCASFPKQGGIYNWAKLAFGKNFAFIAIWLQWINTMVWYPTILSFIAGTAIYLIDPALAENKYYLMTVILAVFWLLTLLNLKGIKTSARFASRCAVFGTGIPVVLIILLASAWLLLGKPLQIHFTLQNLIPQLNHGQSWVSLTAVMTSFLGMELATVHVRDIHNARQKFPKALLLSVILIGSTMLFGALAIAIVIPANQINLVDGVVQAFTNFFNAYHLDWLIPLIVILIIIGSFGGIINWVISPAKGLLQAADDGFLPKVLTKKNQHDVPYIILLLQGVLVTFVCAAFLLMPSVNGSYWLLTDLSTQLYMFMYVLMFIAAIAIKQKFNKTNGTFMIWGKRKGMWLVCLLGLMGTLITITVGFIPPDNIKVGGAYHYEILFSGGLLVMFLPALLFLFIPKLCYKQPITEITEINVA